MIYAYLAAAVAAILLLRSTHRLFVLSELTLIVILLLLGGHHGRAAPLVWVLTGLVLFALGYAIRHRIGFTTTMSGLREIVEVFVPRGCHQATLRVRHTNSNRGIEFIKLDPLLKPTRFLMRVDARRCSPKDFEAARRAIENRGIQTETQRDKKARLRYLTVECGQDVDKALWAARAVLIETFGLTWDTEVHVSRIGVVSIRPEVIIGWGKRLLDIESTTEENGASLGDSVSVGAKGTILSAGRAEFDGKKFDVLCQGSFADPGTEVEIVKIEGDTIVVRKVEKAKE